MRQLSRDEAWPFILCVYEAERAANRLAASRPREPVKPRPHPDPMRRRRDPQRDYGLAEAELPEWRWLMSHKDLTAIEAANVVIRSRREVKA